MTTTEMSYEIISNNHGTVWINSNLGCIARYCRLSGEIFKNDRTYSILYENWDSWKKRVDEIFNIKVNDSYQSA